MFNNTILYYIDYLINLKDEEININFLLIHDIFIKYYNKMINKDYLLDEHSRRNHLFIEWIKIYNYKQ